VASAVILIVIEGGNETLFELSRTRGLSNEEASHGSRSKH
jgi:hypothetical protein